MITLTFLGAASLAAGCRETTLDIGDREDRVDAGEIISRVEALLPAGFPVQILDGGAAIDGDRAVASGSTLAVVPLVVGG